MILFDWTAMGLDNDFVSFKQALPLSAHLFTCINSLCTQKETLKQGRDHHTKNKSWPNKDL